MENARNFKLLVPTGLVTLAAHLAELEVDENTVVLSEESTFIIPEDGLVLGVGFNFRMKEGTNFECEIECWTYLPDEERHCPEYAHWKATTTGVPYRREELEFESEHLDGLTELTQRLLILAGGPDECLYDEDEIYYEVPERLRAAFEQYGMER